MTKDIRTADRLRHDIDSSASSGKVAFPDPAASPLGTDDEAGGRPNSVEAVQEAASHELRGGTGTAHGQSTSETGRLISGEPGRTANATATPGFILPLVGVLVLAAIVGVIGFLVV
ncbi:hypothetical protein [Mongoliimonas terrestris]|uniref:hypothetical protein n=1 Tax=Mongoliimonas terrestris TaxID=1709001 RepID=UPI0009494FB2|nr:hypothetical protein [Mongoliimonas terrestris]